MITTVFISKCALWQNMGKGKLNPRFVTSAELRTPTSRGWQFTFLPSVGSWTAHQTAPRWVFTQPGSGQPLSPRLQMACKQSRCGFWAEVCHHSGLGGWGQPDLSVWEAESCQDMPRQLLLMSTRSAQPSEKWWDILRVMVCLSNSFNSSPFRCFWWLCAHLCQAGNILAHSSRIHAALCSFPFFLSL